MEGDKAYGVVLTTKNSLKNDKNYQLSMDFGNDKIYGNAFVTLNPVTLSGCELINSDGRIYCGIDKLNMECLEWLDDLGNGQINTYTKKTPREMFKNEYGKLIKVYEKKNTDIVVLTPRNSVIEYMNNRYKLPEKSFSDDSRIRVERHDNTLLFYHALTNDLICKHKIPEGTGNIVV